MILIISALAGWVVYSQPTRKGLDIQGGMRVVLRAEKEKLPPGSKWDADKLSIVTDIIRKRVDSLGVAEPIVYPMPAEDRIIVELPGVKDKQQALAVVGSTAKMEFRSVPEFDNGTYSPRPATGKDGSPTGFEEILRDGKPVPPEELEARIFSKDPLLTGKQLKPNARAELLQTGKSIIHFEFQDDAKQIFEDFTRGHIGKRLAIFLDNKLISAPNINDVIPGEGIIEGNFTPESAKTLSEQLNAGALPVPLEQLQLDNIEATLGAQAVHQTLIAGVVGLAAVLVFMLWWYRMPGLLADLALCLYALFTFAMFKLIPITLTVPGIAGFILSIGMAVDANILIFERMKEERKSGKSLRASIETGFKRAFTAIFDSNVCTLITCGVLYQLGTGQVRGFAVTLAVGVAISLFTAVTCSRTFLLLFANSAAGQNDNLYGLGGGLHPHLQVTKRMKLWFAVSLLIILPGILAMAAGGIKRSIEFTGGTEISAQFATTTTAPKVQSVLATAGHKEARVLIVEGGSRAYITTKSLNDAEKAEVGTVLKGIGGTVLSDSNVSGTISSELTRNAVLSVVFASLLIILYLALRFSIPNFVEGLKFGTCAVIALLHDAFVLLGLFAVMGYLFNWQVDSLFVTAMLTVIGFSVHDTIIIFDRMRENLQHRQRGETFDEVADRSIEQTFARSVYTSFTVVLTLLALLIFGGPVLKLFVTALLIGIISGTYSSIFNATPLLVLWRRWSGEPKVAAATAGGLGSSASGRPTPRKPDPSSRPRVTPPPGPAGQSTSGSGSGSLIYDADGNATGAAKPNRVQPKKPKRRM